MLHSRSSFASAAVTLAASLLFGCSSRSGGDAPVTPSEGGNSSTGCIAGSALTGASYDVTKSRFAFGSTPVAVDAGILTRWTGKDGVVAIFTDGSELASLNGGVVQPGVRYWDRGASRSAVVAIWPLSADQCRAPDER
jgi:hypothetical protein